MTLTDAVKTRRSPSLTSTTPAMQASEWIGPLAAANEDRLPESTQPCRVVERTKRAQSRQLNPAGRGALVRGETAAYPLVQGLSRGLALLCALGDADANGATPRELSEATGLHRSTVKRLLETLVREGFLRSCGSDGSYGLADRVQWLSRGFNEEARLLQHAGPQIKGLAERTGWSLRLCTPQVDWVVIRDSTHAYSNLSFEASGALRQRLPMLLTAAGRACFAHMTGATRQRIVNSLRVAPSQNQSALARNDRLLEELTKRVRGDGYAINDGDWGERRLGGVGLAVRSRAGRVVGSLSLMYMRRLVTRQVIDNEFVPELRSCVSRVEEQLNAALPR